MLLQPLNPRNLATVLIYESHLLIIKLQSCQSFNPGYPDSDKKIFLAMREG
jgi:hypothetical protein